jgi:hypothetical protein
MNAVCAYLAWRIKQTMGAAYTDAMRWLFYAMLTYAAMSIHFVVLSYVGYDNTAYGRTGAYLGVFAILSTMFVIAGYKFWQIGIEKTVAKSGTALDVVMYAASLATNTSEIDPILDDVRILTAQLDPEHIALTADHERSLGKIYLKLEDYLVSHEPLRKLTKDDLRQRVERQLPRSDDNPFWSIIAAR